MAYKSFSNFLNKTTALYHIGTVAVAMCTSTSALANPEDGKIVAGNAFIEQFGNKLNVRQSSQRAIIDWRSFNIEASEHTEFHQPSTSSVTLNRVSSQDPSRIMGKLTANGNVMLVNPNGVVFGKDAKVDVTGIVATTADIRNEDFMAGNMKFSQPGNPEAAIVNHGTITAHEAGLIGLVAPNVVNDGIIQARLGRVQLASGDKTTIDLYGDGLIQIEVSDVVKSQLVSNTGAIVADGGAIIITAAAGAQIVNSVINMDGVLQAQSISDKEGNIKIYAEGNSTASGESKVNINGSVDASGRRTGERGGSVEILGDNITLGNNAVIDASGHSSKKSPVKGKESATVTADNKVRSEAEFLASDRRAGGSIKIGGDYLGKGSTPTAKTLKVDSNAKILNDATESGDAGRTILWSDDKTDFTGKVYARGGALGGNGGFVETSGKKILTAKGYVNLTAVEGFKGLYLLDPANITIYNRNMPSGNGVSSFTASDIETLSQTANVSLFADNSINIDLNGDSIVMADDTNLSLTTTNGDISAISQGTIKTNGGDITFTAGGSGSININNDFTLTALVRLPYHSSRIDLTTSGSGNININAPLHWDGTYTTLSSQNGISIASLLEDTSNQTYRYLRLQAKNFYINAPITGVGSLTFTSADSSHAFNVGDTGGGAAGGNNYISSNSLDYIGSGWWANTFESKNGTMNVAARNWTTPYLYLDTGTGVLNIDGAQNVGAGDLILTALNDISINAPISGSGSLTFRASGAPQYTVMNIGDVARAANPPSGGNYAMNVRDNSLANLQDGWNGINFEGAYRGGINIASNYTLTFADPVTFMNNDATINLNGNITASPSSNAGVTFYGSFFATHDKVNIQGTIDTSAGSSDINIFSADEFILNGDLISGGGLLIDNKTPFQLLRNTSLKAGNGNLYIAEDIDLNNYDLSLEAPAMSLHGDIVGSGSLSMKTNYWSGNGSLATASGSNFTFSPYTVSYSLGLGDALRGYMNLLDSQIAEIQAGFSNYTFGSSSGQSILNSYSGTWNNPVTFLTGNNFLNYASLTSTSKILVDAGGSIILYDKIASTGSGDAVVLSAGGSFLNLGNSQAVSVTNPNGRWLVYSSDPSYNTRSGLMPDHSDFGKTYAANAPATIGAGNRFVYATSNRPVITFKIDDANIQEGDQIPGGSMTYDYGVLYDDGTINDIGLTGQASFTTHYQNGDGPGFYTITASANSLTSPLGYDFSFTPGTLTVTGIPVIIPHYPAPSSYKPKYVDLSAVIEQPAQQMNNTSASDVELSHNINKILFVDPALKSFLGIEGLNEEDLL